MQRSSSASACLLAANAAVWREAREMYVMFVEWMPVNIARAKLFRNFFMYLGQGNLWMLVVCHLGSCGVEYRLCSTHLYLCDKQQLLAVCANGCAFDH